MKYLVTGGAGFIGSVLAKALVTEGHQVKVLDDLSTGMESNIAALRRFNTGLEKSQDDLKFALHVGTATVFSSVCHLVDWADAVFHLAAVVGVRNVLEHPVNTMHVNLASTENVLVAADKDKKPVLIASSSEVYGKSEHGDFHEGDDLVLGPTSHGRWCYAATKALDEWMAFAHTKEKGVPTVAARFFNISGPGQRGRYGMVLPVFVRQAIAGLPITVFGDGKQRRTFTHVSDAVFCIMRLMELLQHGGDEVNGRAFNIGTTHPITIMDLAWLVKAEVGDTSRGIITVPYEEAYPEGTDDFQDMAYRCPDVGRLKRAIGYVPETPLEEIIRDIIAEVKSK